MDTHQTLHAARRVDAPPGSRAWRWFLAAGVVAIGLHYALPMGLQHYANNIIGISGPLAILFGIQVHGPRHPGAWYAMAIGQLLLAAGDIMWTIYAEVLKVTTPFPSAADVAYLAGYIPLMVGLVWVVRTRQPGRDIPSVLDAAIVTVGATVIAWVFLIAPQTTNARLHGAGRIVAIAYPLADVMLVAVTARVLFTPGLGAPALRFIGFSLIVLIFADSAFTFLSLHSTYFNGHSIQGGWLLSFVLWGTAALHPSMRGVTEPVPVSVRTPSSRSRIVALACAALAIPAMQTFQYVEHDHLHLPILIGGTSITFLLVMVRMSGLVTALGSAAMHDSLTGLPNRRLLLDHMGLAIARMQRSGKTMAVLFVDLGGFKQVNDYYGHEAGDASLVEIGQRALRAMRDQDTVARIGGDEFVVVCEDVDATEASEIADRLTAAIEQPMSLRDGFVVLNVDVGVAIADRSTTSPADLLKDADRAMYRAKADRHRSAIETS